MLSFIPTGYSLEGRITWEEMFEKTTMRGRGSTTEELGEEGGLQQGENGSALANTNISQSVCDSVNPL